MEDAVSASTGESGGQIVVAGAGYAALHVALRLTAKLRDNPVVELTRSTGTTTTRRSLSCPGSPLAPAPPLRCVSRSRKCWPSGSASCRPRSVGSTCPAGGCSPEPGRSAGAGSSCAGQPA
jgi:hypothetical protein